MALFYVSFESGWRTIVEATDTDSATRLAIKRMQSDSLFDDAKISVIRRATPQDEYDIARLGRRPYE